MFTKTDFEVEMKGSESDPARVEDSYLQDLLMFKIFNAQGAST